MSGDGNDHPSPDDAFATLGNETRLGILQTLGQARETLSFSELRDRVGVEDSGKFNYHLEQLVGHFVRKTEGGYQLRRAGRRVVEAVLSGAVTDAPDLDRTRVDETCGLCGAPIEVARDGGSIAMYCTECAGRYSHAYGEDPTGRKAAEGYLGRLPLPPAGLQDRTPTAVLRAAWTWGNLEILAMSAGICPRCSATVDHTLRVCEDHDGSGGRCTECRSRQAVRLTVSCTNCIFQSGGIFGITLVSNTHLLDLLTDHGLNPVAPDSTRQVNEVHGDHEESLVSRDPFRARFTFDVDGDRLALTVDDDLDVVEATRGDGGDGD